MLDPTTRVAESLGEHGEQREAILAAVQADLDRVGYRRIRLEDVARHAGVSRQTINQNLKELEVMGVLRLNRGGLEITDLPALQRLAGYGPAQAPTGV